MKIQTQDNQRILFYLVLCFLFAACSDNSQEETFPEAPLLVQTYPENGAIDIPISELVISLVYDQRIKVTADAKDKIIINDASVVDVSVNLTKVDMRISGLSMGKEYELLVPEGVIQSHDKVDAAQTSITFRTVEESHSTPGTPGVLCTPNPSAQSKKVYDYLLSIYGHKSLSSTIANVNWNINEALWVYKHTGKWPAINCFDYLHFFTSNPGGWIDYENTAVVEKWWNDGGLVGIMWHWNMLANDGSSYSVTPGSDMDGKHTNFNISKINDPDSKEYKQIIGDIDKIAGFLKLLKDKNIPVLWRPLHEAAGNYYRTEWNGTAWFWWGYYGPEPFKKLWKLMFDRFVHTHGLNNLIWIWTFEDHDEWYPGDEYVDIVGSDIYSQSKASYFSDRFKDTESMYAGKLATLGECGNAALISTQWNAGAKWLYFMPWYDYERTKDTSSVEFESIDHQYGNIEWWRDALKQDYVLTRDKLPYFK